MNIRDLSTKVHAMKRSYVSIHDEFISELSHVISLQVTIDCRQRDARANEETPPVIEVKIYQNQQQAIACGTSAFQP